MVAVRAVSAGARSAGISFVEYVRSGRDPVSVAIMAEVRFAFIRSGTVLSVAPHGTLHSV